MVRLQEEDSSRTNRAPAGIEGTHMQDKGSLYVISVASRLLALHPQTLRKYERAGFVAPSRTEGNLRLYSPEDLALLRQVKQLVEAQGVNLAGVEIALAVTRMAEHLLDAAETLPARDFRREVQATAAQMLETLGKVTSSE